MRCPKCNSYMFIRTTGYEFEGDDDPNKTTVLYEGIARYCPNKQCEAYLKESLDRRVIAESK